MKRSVGDIVSGATLIERVNGRLWKMKCSCGEIFIAQPSSTKGLCRECAMKKMSKERTVHGESPCTARKSSRLYRIWLDMRSRCNNENKKSYSCYGGRGITVCSEWSDYRKFKEWALSHGYSDELTVDRIDVNGNYEPSNCRWATMKEQSNNKRNNHLFTYNGKTQTIAQWAKEYDIKYDTLKRRINNYGFCLEEALTITPKIGNNQATRSRKMKHKPEMNDLRKQENRDENL